MCSDHAVVLEGLSKAYRIYDRPRDRLLQMLPLRARQHYREFWALKEVSLTIRKGETVGVIGRNGSGKSTLLQLICGTVMPSSGSVRCNGRIAALLELGSGFNPDFTGRENVYLNAAILGLSKAEIDERFEEIADFAGIGGFIDQPTRSYSSGMMVRLAFAVSVCVEPDILIVDEALAVGDAAFQFKCLNRLEEMTNRGLTLLFVSHDMSMVKRFCHRAVYLHAGEVRASGLPEEMAELYLLDMRDEQRSWASSGRVAVTRKAFLGERDGIAFGTDEGRMLAASFTNTGSLYSSFVHGENVEIRVEALVRDTLQLPTISLTVQETRLLVIGGANVALTTGTAIDGWRTAVATLRFPVRLGAGRYHVTLKLLNGRTEETALLIEKQVGLMTFDVLPGDGHFLGIVDLGMEKVEQDLTGGEPCPGSPARGENGEREWRK